MSKCQTCGTPVIMFERTKEMGYVNAAPWIRVLIFKVANEKDNAVFQFDFCSPQCLAKFAKVIANETEPIKQNEEATTGNEYESEYQKSLNETS